MKKLWKVKIAVFAVVSLVAVAAVLMWTWNWLVPDLFHGPSINFYQTLGLMLISRILFRGFHGMGGRGMNINRWGRWKEHWEKMDPEQREKMRDLWKKRCGGFDCKEEKKDN